jgi:hypothetical protein
MRGFFGNPYWRRLWTVKEILVARDYTIYYGSFAIKMAQFENFATSIRIWGLQSESFRPELFTRSSLAILGGQAQEPCLTINSCLNHLCEEPRDRYYALQSLFDAKWRLPVDYTKPVEEVFVDAAIMVLESESCRKSLWCYDAIRILKTCWLLARRMKVVAVDDWGFAYRSGYAILFWWCEYFNAEGVIGDCRYPLLTKRAIRLKRGLEEACTLKDIEPSAEWSEEQDDRFKSHASHEAWRILSIFGGLDSRSESLRQLWSRLER